MNTKTHTIDHNKTDSFGPVRKNDVPVASTTTHQNHTDALNNMQWSRAAFLKMEKQIEALLYSKEFAAAVDLSEALQRKCVREGDTVYLEAPQDIAKAYLILGRVLKHYGSPHLALQPLSESQRRYAILSTGGSPESTSFLIETTAAQGDCLRDLGRLKEAATAYEQAIHYGSKSQISTDKQERNRTYWHIAGNMVELAATYVQMGHYSDALVEYQEAFTIIQKLSDHEMMASVLHQMGIVYMELDQLGQAETVFAEAWNLSEDIGDRARSADTLTELGNLWNIQGGLKEAAGFYHQAILAYVQLGYVPEEGAVRSNMADVLIEQGKFTEAQVELERAIECEQAQGHAAEPWKTWNIVRRLHNKMANKEAESDAYNHAISSYTAYRQAGGSSQSAWAPICTLVLDAIKSKNYGKAENVLNKLLTRQDLLESDQLCIRTLKEIIGGNHSPTLADNIQLNYLDAAELKLLFESI